MFFEESELQFKEKKYEKLFNLVTSNGIKISKNKGAKNIITKWKKFGSATNRPSIP